MERITKFNNDVKDALSGTKPLKMETKTFSCPQCEIKTDTKGDMKLHMKSCHTKPGLSPPKKSKMIKINNGKGTITNDSDMKMIDMMEADINMDDKISEITENDKKFPIIQQPLIENLHSCYYCDFDSEVQGDLDEHVRRIHVNQFLSVSEDNVEKAVTTEGVNVMEVEVNNDVDDVEEMHKDADISTGYKSFKDDADLKAHLEGHNKQHTFNCVKCEETFCTDLEHEWHIETVHYQQIFSCEKCKFHSQTENELNMHFQTTHMITKVVVGSDNQELVGCNVCEYKCKLNIQLKKHKKLKHTSDSMQNNYKKYIKQEMETMRKELKEAFESFADIIGDVLGDHRVKTDANIDTLSETVLKLGEKLKKIENKNKLIIQKRKIQELDKIEKPKTNVDSTKSYASAVKGSSTTSSPSKQTTSSVESTILTSRRKHLTFLSKPKALYVADSVGHSLSLREVEAQQQCRIVSERAYSSVYSERTQWPRQNFTDVVKSRLQNPGREKIEVLIMSAPTVDITNLEVNISQTANNKNKLENAAKLSSQNMFSLAERSLCDNQSLKKVIIMEHPPRFDLPDQDPHSVKPNLAKLANIHLGQLWLNSSLKDKIVIGRHSLESPGVGAVHYKRYQNSFTGRYDGVHLYGQRGYTDYTNSVKTILSLALPVSPQYSAAPKLGKKKVKVESDNHTNCPQAQYQRNKYPSIQIRNRFDVLSQGNF